MNVIHNLQKLFDFEWKVIELTEDDIPDIVARLTEKELTGLKEFLNM